MTWTDGPIGAEMRFHLLGTLEIVDDSGSPIVITRARIRQLLAVLLLMDNRPASSEFLVRAVWGDDQPSARLGTLRSHLHLVRQFPTLAGRLRRDVGGYVLEVGQGELDLDDFRELADRGGRAAAAGELATAERLWRQALGLWRRPEPLDAPDTLVMMGETAKLVGERLRLGEQLTDLLLRQGRHRELVPELEVSVSADPLNERAWEQLIMALYGCGRRAGALQTYRRAHAVLADTCGIEPGPRLQRLCRWILDDDPALVAG